MAAPSFEPVDLKLGRAQEHLDALDADTGRYFAGEPYRFVREYHPEGSRVAGLAITEEPPERLALVIGDYLHNARAALDYLAWQLVLASGITPNGRTKFPISKDPRLKKKRRSGVVVEPGVSAPILAVVESLQPYHAPDPALHPLWLINELSNIDKHRTLHPIVAWVRGAERFDVLSPGDDTPRPTFIFPNRPLQGDVEMHAEQALRIMLAEPPRLRGRPVVGLLGETLKFLREDACARLKPFLD